MSPAPAIRPERAGDRPGVLGVVEAAFGPDKGPTVARLVTALHDGGCVRASLVAQRAGRVVGHVQLNRSWLDAARALTDVLVLSPLAVDPDHQRSGVGTALLTAAVEEAGRLGAPAVFLEGDPGYYAARGWRPAGPLGFTSPSVRIPDAAFQVVLLPAYEPWMSGALVYCDPFWALDCVGLRPSGRDARKLRRRVGGK
jgi:putative acetyltransferase